MQIDLTYRVSAEVADAPGCLSRARRRRSGCRLTLRIGSVRMSPMCRGACRRVAERSRAADGPSHRVGADVADAPGCLSKGGR